MSVTIQDNTVTYKNQTTRNANLALRFIMDAIQQTADPKTPKRLGNLRRDTLKSVVGLHGSIEWKKRYAGYQEEKQYKHYTTPGTGPHYAQNAVKAVVAKSDQYFHKAGLI
jgi:Minor capsid protein